MQTQQQTPQQQASFFERYLNGEFDNHPLVQRLNNMLFGKSQAEQIEIMLNILESNGYDIHAKNIPEEVVNKFLQRTKSPLMG
ncbi:MAG: hypothetical protein IJ184_03140 [Alphaproteobacteria bacterium]|nr:hypothetical protein [Alphaproteobacteria bacterium]